MVNQTKLTLIYIWSFFGLAHQSLSNPTNNHQVPLKALQQGTPGCGLPPPFSPGRSENFAFYSKHGGGQREYILHLPPSYNLSNPHPLIFSYHGFTQNMRHQERISKFSNATVNPDAITVYPQGLGSPPAWQSAPYSPQDVDDLAFTSDLVAHLKASYCVDEKRIFATGMSNGGGFVNRLACSSQGRHFAAFAAVAGAFYGDVVGGEFECEPTELPISMFEMHGDEDGIIPYRGGEASGVFVPAIPDWLRRWAVRNGCSDSCVGKERDLEGGNVQETSYSCSESHRVVVGLKVKGMGHVWPSTTPNDDNGNMATWIDAAPHILKYFDLHYSI